MKSLLPSKTIVPVYFVGVIAAFCLGIVLIAGMYRYARFPGVDQARQEERRRTLAELRAQAKQQGEFYGVVNSDMGQYRLPVARAMELTAQEWSDPAAGRSNLLSRLRALQAPGTAAKPQNKGP
jgi:hypothetical protein